MMHSDVRALFSGDLFTALTLFEHLLHSQESHTLLPGLGNVYDSDHFHPSC